MLKTIAGWFGYDLRPRGSLAADLAYRSLENPSVSLQDPDAWEEAGWTTGTESGESVGVDKALTYSPVWQAVGMISGDVSKLPLDVFKRDGEERSVDRSHPAYPLINLLGKANDEVTSLSLWRRFLVHALLWPRGYIWIDRAGDGTPLGLYNLLPDRTYMEKIRGRLRVISEIDGRLEAFAWDDVLVLENVSIDQVTACGLVNRARHNIGVALARRRFQSKFFSNGLHAGGVLQVPPGASDKARKKVEEAIADKKFSKDNAFKTLVLRDGFKFHTTMVNPEQAQMAEQDEEEVRHVARFYRMAPSRLGAKESISYNSEEAAKRAYYDETLSYWLTAIKAETNVKLLTEHERRRRTHFIDYNVQALLWADTNTVMSVGTRGVQWGIFNRDEVRRWFNMNPIAGGEGEKFYRPKNMDVAGEKGKDGKDQGDGSDGDSKNEQQRAAIDEQQRAATIEALRALIGDAVTRMVTRLTIHAQKSAKRGKIAEFLAAITEEHGDKCEEIFEPVRAVCEACGLGSGSNVPYDVLANFYGECRLVADNEDDMAAWCDIYREAAPAHFAERFLGNQTDNLTRDKD